jgi:hypothetical protein
MGAQDGSPNAHPLRTTQTRKEEEEMNTPQQSNDVPRAEHDRVLRELNHQQQANYKLDWHASEARCAALNAKIAMLRSALKRAADAMDSHAPHDEGCGCGECIAWRSVHETIAATGL